MKQDVLALQQEFNKVDPGWGYGEGCTGSGYNRLYATDCTLGIINNIGSANIRSLDYYASLIEKNRFKIKSHTDNIYFLDSTSFSNSKCAFQSGKQEESKYYSLRCHADAREFYFKRTDL